MATIYVPKGTTDLSGLGIADGDTVIIAEGGQAISSGLNLSALAEGLAFLNIGPGFTGTIGGGSSGPLRVDVDSGSAILKYGAGGGALYYQPDGDEDLADKIRAIGRGALYLQSGGTVTDLEVKSGRVNITGDVICTNLLQTGGEVAALYKSNVFASAIVIGGTLYTGRGFTTATIGGTGTVMVRREDTGATLPVATTINGYGGRLVWSGGAVTTINWYDGELDFSQCPNDITIGTLNITEAAYRKSKLTSAIATVTITTRNMLAGDQSTW